MLSAEDCVVTTLPVSWETMAAGLGSGVGSG